MTRRRLLIYSLIFLVVQMYGCDLGGRKAQAGTLRKLHLVRPDLILFPIDVRYYA